MLDIKRTIYPNSIEIEHVFIPKHYELRGHSHSNIHLCIILNGSFEEIDNAQIVNCCKNTVRISGPRTNHEIYFGSEGCECLIINLNNRFQNFNKSNFLKERSSCFNTFSMEKIDLISKCSSSALSPFKLEVLLREFLSSGFIQYEEPCWLKEARFIIDENPASSLNISEIAKKVGIHRGHLSRTFNRFIGCTIREYIILKKLEAAHNFLKEPALTISAAANEAGFFDQSHFNRLFKKYINMNPISYKLKYYPNVTNVQDKF